MDISFSSVEELYKRIKPALKTKKKEMERLGYSYIKEKDIWYYLKDNKWRLSNNLSLYQMVTDILNCDNLLIDNYVKSKLKLRSNKEIRSIYEKKENMV